MIKIIKIEKKWCKYYSVQTLQSYLKVISISTVNNQKKKKKDKNIIQPYSNSAAQENHWSWC